MVGFYYWWYKVGEEKECGSTEMNFVDGWL